MNNLHLRLYAAAFISLLLVACGGSDAPASSTTSTASTAAPVAMRAARPGSPVAQTAPLPGSTIILVPLYLYPSNSSTWSALVTAKQANPYVSIVAIVNPDSGPGSAYDPLYGAGIAQLQAAGITVFGYVHTSYGAVDIASLESQMSQYMQWYNPSGMFFDEMAYTTGSESYYATLTQYARSLGMTTTIGNPGTDSLPSYIGTVDTIVIYENSGYPTLPFLSGGWHASYAKSNFAYIAYNVATLDTVMEQASSAYVKYEYITDQTAPNPYNAFPSYLSDELAGLGQISRVTSTLFRVK